MRGKSKSVGVTCTPCKLKWHKKFYTCWCKFIWETPFYKIKKLTK